MTKKTKPVERKEENNRQRITTFLTFDGQAEDALKHYVSIFKNSRIVSMVRSDEKGPIPKGKLLNATFELDGQQFMAMDGGPASRSRRASRSS